MEVNSSKNKETINGTVKNNSQKAAASFKKENKAASLNDLVKIEESTRQNSTSKKNKKKKKQSSNIANQSPQKPVSTNKDNSSVGKSSSQNKKEIAKSSLEDSSNGNKKNSSISSSKKDSTSKDKPSNSQTPNLEENNKSINQKEINNIKKEKSPKEENFQSDKSKESQSIELANKKSSIKEPPLVKENVNTNKIKEDSKKEEFIKESKNKNENSTEAIIEEERHIKDELTRQIPVISKDEVATYFKNNQTKNLTITDKFNYEDLEDNPSVSTKTHRKNKTNKVLVIIIFIILILLLSSIYLTIPKIYLNGDKNITLSYKDTYTEPGYSAKQNFKDITKEIKIDSNLKEKTLGEYQITYKINYLFLTIKKTRKITIVDKDKPTITVPSNPIKVCPNTTLDEIDYKAYDDYDGDITSKVTLKESQNKLSLNVKDSSQNEFSLEVKINRLDDDAPVITLKNNQTVYLTSGETYNEPGYTATDNCDGDITSKVTTEGTVGTSLGTYHIIYKVTDSAGNTATTTRTVIRRNSTTPPNSGVIENNTIYLTFDDGPSSLTTGYILDVLKEEGVKATFFVTCNGPDSLIKRIYDEGHTIALHTASHNYSYVYSSVDNYFADLSRVSERVKNITGIESKIIRFPGGSSNTISRTYRYGIMTELTNEVISRGYRYYDWNVDSNDAGSAHSSQEVYQNVVNNLSPYRANMVLMHDIKTTTKDAIRDIIRYGKNNGYTFKQIETNTYMVRHPVNN